MCISIYYATIYSVYSNKKIPISCDMGWSFGGAEESRTPVRKSVHKTFYERSRCFNIPSIQPPTGLRLAYPASTIPVETIYGPMMRRRTLLRRIQAAQNVHLFLKIIARPKKNLNPHSSCGVRCPSSHRAPPGCGAYHRASCPWQRQAPSSQGHRADKA